MVLLPCFRVLFFYRKDKHVLMIKKNKTKKHGSKIYKQEGPLTRPFKDEAHIVKTWATHYTVTISIELRKFSIKPGGHVY